MLSVTLWDCELVGVLEDNFYMHFIRPIDGGPLRHTKAHSDIRTVSSEIADRKF